MFVRNSRVAGSSRPLAGLAALISVLSGTAVVIGGGLYTFGEQTCTTGFFFGTTCAAVTYPYQQMGTYLLVGGVIGLLIGLIG